MCSRNHFSRARVTSIKYYQCVCVIALGIRHANRIYFVLNCTDICGLSRCSIFFHITINGMIFEKGYLTFRNLASYI